MVKYDLTIANGTLFPDGYRVFGQFYSSGKSYLGPTIDVIEGDTLAVSIANNAGTPQTINCKGRCWG